MKRTYQPCLEELRRHFEALAEPVRSEAQALLERHSRWESLWRVKGRGSDHDPEGSAPFCRGLRVFHATTIQPSALR